MNELFEQLLALSLTDTWALIGEVVRNPGSNPTAFAMVLGVATVILVLIVLLLILAIGGEGDDDEDGSLPQSQDLARDIALEEALHDSPDASTPPVVQRGVVETRPADPRKRLIWGLVWTVAFALVWVFAGYMTRLDSICLSCHPTAGIHGSYAMEGVPDPHATTDCVSCHETPNIVASVTTRVPARVMHFVTGATDSPWARGYDPIVTNRACLGCHAAGISGTLVNDVRGIRTSHEEPLAASARCTDCHAPQPETGVVDRYTVGMDPCLRCHDNVTVSAECSYCHLGDRGYAAATGNPVTPKAHTLPIRCEGCHTADDGCDSCHGIRMPHSDEFKMLDHARAAAEDLWFNGGQLCEQCHTATRNPCTKCHIGGFPHHPVSYMPRGHQSADPYANGCDNCHGSRAYIQGRNFCGVCHERWRSVE